MRHKKPRWKCLNCGHLFTKRKYIKEGNFIGNYILGCPKCKSTNYFYNKEMQQIKEKYEENKNGRL